MVDSIVNAFVDFFKNDVPAELIAFIVSLFPVLELRGGMIAARLLEIDFIKAFLICYIGNMIPIPFILLFIKKIFAIMRKNKHLANSLLPPSSRITPVIPKGLWCSFAHVSNGFSFIFTQHLSDTFILKESEN